MDITNGSDLLLRLDLYDKKGEKMTVAQCATFMCGVFTTDERYALTYAKTDVVRDGEYDCIPIDSYQLEKLNSGVIQYWYSYSVHNANFSGTESYDKVRTIVTDFLWINNGNLQNSQNVVTWEIIKRLQDAIAACGAECSREIGALKLALENKSDRDEDFDKALDDLLKSLAETDANVEEIFGIIEELKNSIGKNETDIENLTYRVDALKAAHETVDKELDRRIDATERVLNVINDSNENTPGSIANALKQSKTYADNLFADSRNGLVTEAELEKVRGEIPNVPKNLSAFNNDCGFISGDEYFRNYETKTDAETKHQSVLEAISVIESTVVHNDEITQVFDPEGNLIRRIDISLQPDYYDIETIDSKLAEINEKIGNVSDGVNDRIQSLESIDHEEFAKDASLNELKNELSEVSAGFDSRIKVLEGIDHEIFATDSSLAELKENVENRLDSLEAIDHEQYATNSSLNELKTELSETSAGFDSRIKSLEEIDHNSYALKTEVEAIKVEIAETSAGFDNRIKVLESIDHEKFATDASLNEFKEEVAEESKKYFKVWIGKSSQLPGQRESQTLYCVTGDE